VKTNFAKFCALMAGLVVLCVPTFGHHGSAAYDNSKVVVLKDATVTKVNWGNPHIIFQVDAKDDKGDTRHWVIEGGQPSATNTAGWTKNAVNPGDVVTVYVYAAKNGNPVGRTGKVVLADGRTFGNGELFDQTSTCDKDFTAGGSSSAACRPDGRKTQASEIEPGKK